jgi:phospholipase B1
VVSLDKYKGREDFAVVLQPFLEDTKIPVRSDGKPDTSYLAPDCFHFSGEGAFV